LASHGDLSTYEMAKRLLEETPAEEIRPAPLLRGDDLIAQGYSPGPIFKEILQAVEDAQLEGKIHTPAEALSLVVERFPPSRP
jgi:poly(A) polymerase